MLAAAAASFLFAGQACDDGPAATTGSIAVSVLPAALSIVQGGSGSVTVELTRSAGFSGDVRLAISGLPQGVAATVTPAVITGAVTSATIDMTVDVAVAPGAYEATVTASADGIDEARSTYTLDVTAAPEYALSVVPAVLTIVAGVSSSATIGIERTNFAGEVSLSLISPSGGITGVFDAPAGAASAAALIVSVAAGVVPGSYALTIEGSNASIGVRSTTLTIVVPSPPAGANVEYRFCDASAAPLFFAIQDGTGAWRPVSGITAGNRTSYAFNLTQGHGGVLLVYRFSASAPALNPAGETSGRPTATRARQTPRRSAGAGGAARRRAERAGRVLEDAYVTEVLWATTAEMAQDGFDACAQTQPTRTVTGTVAGVPANGYGIVSFGNTTQIFIGGTSTNPIEFDVPSGLNDLAASRVPVAGNPPDRIVVFRNLDVPDGGALPSSIDFDGPASSIPATAIVTTTGSGNDDLEVYTDLVTANSRVGLWSDLAPSRVAARPWAGLGTAAMQSGDFHGLVVFATPPNRPGDFRVTLEYVGAVANRMLSLGPDMSDPVPAQISGGAYPRLRFQGTLAQEYGEGVELDVATSDGSGNEFAAIASGAYLAARGGRLVYDLEMPDVAGLAGFPLAAALTAGVNDVAVGGFGFDGPGIFDLRPTPGTRFRAAQRVVQIAIGN